MKLQIKKWWLILLVVLAGLSAESARLNVVTDMPSAEIYVNGEFVGRDYVNNIRLEPGEHYVMVKNNGKKIFAKTYLLGDGEVKTVSTAHFVDLRTNVASRGAVDTEAARIRETRGDFAIGAYASSYADSPSIGGVSIKKWFFKRLGVQGIGFISKQGEAIKYQSEGRLLFWLADKVVFDAPYSGYLFVGYGSDNLVNDNDPSQNVRRTLSSGGFGIEFSPFGVNGLFLSLELGMESRSVHHYDPSKDDEKDAGMIGGVGLHFYF